VSDADTKEKLDGSAKAGHSGASAHNGKTARPRLRTIGNRRIIAEGLERNLWSDFYHNAMTVTWPAFIALLAAAFLSLNVVFAAIYALGEDPIANARKGDFADLFFFSVETTSTVGYGDMHPQSMFGHIVATAENFTGLVLLAVMTGLVFARFSRPRARLIFSKFPVLTNHNALPTLIVRVANARSNFISEATARLWMLAGATSQEGRRLVGFQPMRLIKSENPAFALSWSLFHPIDETSPMYGLGADDLAASEINFVISISGFDETSGQMIHARETFTSQDVRFGHEFVDINAVDDNGIRHIDYARISETRPADAPQAIPS
jgi:inward rectifier potassium channel